jgi:hypothetical protein
MELPRRVVAGLRRAAGAPTKEQAVDAILHETDGAGARKKVDRLRRCHAATSPHAKIAPRSESLLFFFESSLFALQTEEPRSVVAHNTAARVEEGRLTWCVC